MKFSATGLSVVVLLAGLVTGGGCSGDESGEERVRKPWNSPSESTRFRFDVTWSDGTKRELEWRVTDQVEVNGKTWPNYHIGVREEGAPPAPALDIQYEFDGRLVTAAGGSIWVPELVEDPALPVVTGTFTEPLTLSLTPPLGQPVEFAVKGSITINNSLFPNNPYSIDTKGTYTLISDSESLETGVGTLEGVSHFTGSAEVLGVPVTVEVWYHPDFGVVGAKTGPDGVFADLTQVLDYGDTGSDGYREIQGTAVLDGEHRRFELSTFDINQDFDADKDTHALMLAEIRWLDPAKAMDSSLVPPSPEFGTTFGYFFSEAVASPVSVFFPEENGLGYTYWISFVSQGAKNEPSNGIEYNCKLEMPDGATDAIRVTARILSKEYRPSSP